MNEGPLYTIKLSFNESGEKAKLLLSTAWLFKIACHRVLGKSKTLYENLVPSKIAWIKMFKYDAYSIIPNKRYSYGAVYLVYGVWESARKLGVDYRAVELSDWLMFQHYEREVGGNVVRIHEDGSALVTVYGYNGSKDRILIKAKPNKGQAQLLKAVVEENEKYMPRVVIRDYGVRDNAIYVRGEIHVSVSYDFYVKHAQRFSEPKGNLIGGVDVNVDRINLAIVDEKGRLRDVKTFWFRETTSRGYPGKRAWSTVGAKVHEVLNYAYHHGVRTIALENPETLGRLKLAWIRGGERKNRNYNYKVMLFRNSIIERIAWKTPLYGMEVKYISLKGTTRSRKHDEAMRKHGLDKHAASAYLIALKSIQK